MRRVSSGSATIVVGGACLAAAVGISGALGEVLQVPPEWAAAAAWMLWIEGCSLAVFPWIRPLFGRFPDRGRLAAKWFGLLGPAYVGWLLGTIWDVSLALSGAAIVLAALLSGWVVPSDPGERGSKDSRNVRGWIVSGELLFWSVFLAFLALRLLNPDIWHPSVGGEKPMDLAILSSLVQSSGFPPTDPWLAGYPLNYYYFGFVPFAWLSRLLEIPPAVAYNLALPTIAALSAGGAFLLIGVLRADRPRGGGRIDGGRTPRRHGPGSALWGPLLVVGVGNLFEPRLLLSGLRQMGRDGDDGIPLLTPLWEAGRGLLSFFSGEASWPYSQTSLYWSATRIIPAGEGEGPPISEFPFFSLLFGDLHPHLMALPACLFFLLTLCSAWSPPVLPDRRPTWLPSVVSGLALGMVLLINPWDLPAALLLLFGFVLGRWLEDRAGAQSYRLRHAALPTAVTLAAAFLTAAPFFRDYVFPVGGFAVWRGSGTILEAFLWHFGLFVLVLAGFLSRHWSGIAGGIIRLLPGFPPKAVPWIGFAGAGITLLLGACGVISGAAAAACILAGAAAGVMAGSLSNPARRAALFCGIGCALVLVPEFLSLTGDVGRMNLVFKFHFAAFWLWALASALILADREALFPTGRVWRAAAGLALAASLCYPPFAVSGRIKDRLPANASATLDGLRFMEQVPFPLQGETVALTGDGGAIRWLRETVRGTPVLVEAVTDDYGPGGRISAATGIPTLLAWPTHQLQHRRRQDLTREIERRRRAVRTIYQAARSEEALELLVGYDVKFVVVGELERTLYGSEGERKFQNEPRFWELAHSSGNTRIYRFRSTGLNHRQVPRQDPCEASAEHLAAQRSDSSMR